MSKKDYYEILGCDKSASDAEIKKSFRRLAMKYHPDRNIDSKDAEVKFKEAKEAYDVLSSAEKRRSYDQFGHAGVDSSQFSSGFSGSQNINDIFGDMFGDIFGGSARQSKSQVFRGADLRYQLELSLEQAISGDSIEIIVPTHISCNDCNGSGAEPGTNPINCSICNGSGQVRVQQGFFSIQQSCHSCKGIGTIIRSTCNKCSGSGRKKKNKKLVIKVPAGVDTGDRIRLAREGEAGQNSGPPGDLYVDIMVLPHNVFERDGQDLRCNVPITFADATLGNTIKVPTIDKQITLKVPPETQSGSIFRLKGKGVKSVRVSGVGDLFCRVHVETPVELTKEQKKMLEKFDKTLNKSDACHNPKTSSWLDSLKGFFDKGE
ncbi:MAG: molecular chaperone DnaJ [Gammaproteobacteria bacterium TMED78]|nr:MAG: molecular chaperone DnaJ [Gammaproteobacteria bacterium TMED78]